MLRIPHRKDDQLMYITPMGHSSHCQLILRLKLVEFNNCGLKSLCSISMASENFHTEDRPIVAGRSQLVAVVFGVTGLVGKELAKKLLSTSTWKVYGVARRPDTKPITDPNFHFISCDLLNPPETHRKLSLQLRDATHLFWITWASKFPINTLECSDLNKEMLANALNAILPTAMALRHVSLQTGIRHYMAVAGPTDDEGKAIYSEENPRLRGYNFYYVLEDLLRERLSGGGKVAWTVLRPALILGSSHRTYFNLIGTLSVYGTICKKLKHPFVFGGTRERWEERYMDASDAHLIADQHIWAATNEEIASSDGQAFNVINGDSFTWKEIWGALGRKFGIEDPEDIQFSSEFCYETAMADKKKVWKEIVEKEGLVQTEMEDLANWGMLDYLFRFPVKLLVSRDKADELGFTVRTSTLGSFLYWIDAMRDEKLIPFT